MEKKILLSLGFLFLFLPREGKATTFGTASWYSESDPGINLTTANGEIFDDSKETCAAWNFPFGTRLRVTHLVTGKTVTCRVNDRGPAKRLGRLIDLTKGAFREIAPLGLGLIPVKVEVVPEPAIEPAYKTRLQQEGTPRESGMSGVKSFPRFS